jgi:hypothetical protein
VRRRRRRIQGIPRGLKSSMRRAATKRPTISSPPAGATGTTTRTGLAGYDGWP